ncbi:MAG: PadR family transcriptional regulator [Candidatus Thorarchaeota archaeon]
MNEFNHFGNNGPRPFHGDLPPGGHPAPHGGHPPPGGPRSPFGFPPFFGHPDHFRPPLPMTHESFKEIKSFMILMILAENPKGITGYQFQEKFGIPRGNVLRTMDDLIELEYVKTSESVIKGRAQKYFIITDKGKEYLNDLKKKWGERFIQMSEMVDPNMMDNIFRFMRKGLEMILTHQLENIDSKEDAIDFFRGLRSKAKTFITKIDIRLNFLKSAKSELDSIIQKLEKMDDLDLEEIKKTVEEFHKKLDDQL